VVPWFLLLFFFLLHAAYYRDVPTVTELKCSSEYSAAVDKLLPLNEHLRQCNEGAEVDDKSDVNEGSVPVPTTHVFGLILYLGGPL
jgi:hypothetical protein